MELEFIRIDKENYTPLAGAELAMIFYEGWDITDAGKLTAGQLYGKTNEIQKDIFQNGLEYIIVNSGTEDDEAIGDAFVAFSTTWIDGYLYLQSTAVRPEYRGKGILTVILEELKRIVKAENLKGIVADIQSENVAPIKANLKAGFEHVTPESLEDIPKVTRQGMQPFSLVSKKSLESGKKAMMVWRP